MDLTLLYILIQGTYGKFAREKLNASARRLLPAAMLELWLHICRVKITFAKNTQKNSQMLSPTRC